MSSDAQIQGRTRELLTRILEKAQSQGEQDPFAGKRRWTRYSCGMSLEMRTPDGDVCDVKMHNVSGGGFGVWSKHELPKGTCIEVRESTDDGAPEWIPAVVQHNSLGVAGYLIGAAFEHPANEEKQAAQVAPAEEDDDGRAMRRPRPPRSMRTRAAYLSAVSCMTAVAAGWCAAFWLSPAKAPVLGLAVAGPVAFLLGGLVSWLCGRSERRFLKDVRVELQEMAAGRPSTTNPPEAPTPELALLRRAFSDVRNRWRRREDDGRAERQKLEDLNLVRSNILSMVSHDLRTPLTSILMYTQMLTDELNTLAETDQRRFLEIIYEECTRLSRLVDDLLEAQRLQAGRVKWQMQPIDLSRTVRNCAAVFQVVAQGKSIEFTLDCDDSLPPVEADEDKLSQVLSNLLSNGLKYTPAGGKLHLSAQADAGEIRICVSDNGPGIPRDQWDEIFDRFSQLSVTTHIRRFRGVGLGLYLVRQIVERHGGSVWVDSEVGRGSSFYVSLPIQAKPAEAAREAGETPSAGRIVVCDADPELASRIARPLREASYDVRLAHSGCRLLAHLDQNHTDVVVTDVLLPDMNAGDLLRALEDRKARNEFKVVVHSYAGEGQELRRQGVDVFLPRPAKKQELLQAARVALQRSTAGGKTVLLVGTGLLDPERFKQAVCNAEHLPITAGSIPSAVALLRDNPIDVVVVGEDLLSADWESLSDLCRVARHPTRVFVACPRPRKKEQRLAARFGVKLLEARPGNEGDLIEHIVECHTTVTEPVA